MRRSWRIETRDGAGDHARLAVHRIAFRCGRRLVSPELIVPWVDRGALERVRLMLRFLAREAPRQQDAPAGANWRLHHNYSGIGELGTLRLKP